VVGRVVVSRAVVGEGRYRKKPHPNSSHFNLFEEEREVITSRASERERARERETIL